MPSEQKVKNFRNIDETFCQVLQRVFYFEETDEEKNVRHFVDWANERGFGPMKDRAVYDIISGRSKPSATLIVAVLSYSNDVELHSLFTADNSINTAASAIVKTARDMLSSVVETLEGNK